MKTNNREHKSRTINLESLFERLSIGNTLITGNARLARVIGNQYSQWRIDRGDLQWSSPDILAWSVWLGSLWEIASLEGSSGSKLTVPSPQQQVSLWETVLNNDQRAASLLRTESLAKQLCDTRKLAKDWQLDFSDFSWMGENNENHAAFHHWNGLFELLCREQGWLPAEDRPLLLCQTINSGQLQLTNNIDLLGFDEFSPVQQQLLSAVEQQSVAIEHLSLDPAKSKPVLFAATEHSHEIEKMASWTRYWLEAETDSSIAIVAPDLAADKDEIEAQLTAVLCPDSDAEKPWNISMGTVLNRMPVIAAAFDLFKLLDSQIDIQSVGRLLRSPWITGGTSERNQRALLEKHLRNIYPRLLKLTEVEYQATAIKDKDRDKQPIPAALQEPNPWFCPQLAKTIQRLVKFKQQHTNKQLASAWAEHFAQLLTNLGWPFPADKPLTAAEQDQNWQTINAWNDCLQELASLDATTAEISANKAISLLTQISQNKLHQAKTGPARVQILGLYEISGLRFDHLWVLGLQADNWPPAAKPNPFIPGSLQRQHKIPHSSPQRELKVANTITRRLLETAADSVFSYAASAAGETQLPSPLLGDIKAVTTVPGWDGKRWASLIEAATKPQWEAIAMPKPLGNRPAKGGSSILKHQATCPFRAFAENRLLAEGLNNPADGIDARVHGSLLHSVLELFWGQTKTQTALLQLTEAELLERVQANIHEVLEQDRALQQRPAFKDVEARRIQRRIMGWLELEKQREDFEVVGFEEKFTPNIAGREIRLYIDRIDQLNDGSKVIIDYKTGIVEPAKWFGERPEDPQLPLYAISAEQLDQQTPAGIAFAVIHDNEYIFKGIVKRAGILPKLPPSRNQGLVDAGENLPQTIENWRQVMHRLMREFLQGEARIDPLNGISTCADSYCDLQPLCRINELSEQQKLIAGESQ